jgi:hypothetical protein
MNKQAVLTAVKDGTPASTDIVFTSTDWELPGAATFTAPDFRSFATGSLTYECTYDNPTNRTITSGPSEATDEQCVAVGYFFPATDYRLCLDNFDFTLP